VIREPQVAPNDMLEQTGRRLFVQYINHLREAVGHRHEPLIGRTNVVQSNIVQQNLLQDESRYSFRQLGACLHRSKAQGDELGSQKEINDVWIVDLH